MGPFRYFFRGMTLALVVLEGLELREAIAELAQELFTFPSWNLEGDSAEAIISKYPGC